MPLPKPHAGPSRRGLLATDRILPAEGRSGPPPKWPSGHKPTPAERAAWRRLWSLPQAVAWEALPGIPEVVERYARASCAVAADLDAGEVRAAMLAQLRGLESDLGLTPAALARLRWSIEPAAHIEAVQVDRRPVVRRMRPRAIDPPPRIADYD